MGQKGDLSWKVLLVTHLSLSVRAFQCLVACARVRIRVKGISWMQVKYITNF